MANFKLEVTDNHEADCRNSPLDEDNLAANLIPILTPVYIYKLRKNGPVISEKPFGLGVTVFDSADCLIHRRTHEQLTGNQNH